VARNAQEEARPVSGYPNTPGAKREGTSADAAEAMADKAATLRAAVRAALRVDRLTADECAAVLGHSVLSIRPRVTELFKMGEIEDAGERRKNASGRNAIVWREKWKTSLFD
jgi:predicted ArsR family transcriptional regulator